MIANLMLNLMFGGRVSPGTFDEQLEEEIVEIKQSRQQKFGAGLYLVFLKDGNVDKFTLNNQGENDEFVICFYGASKESIQKASEPHMQGNKYGLSNKFALVVSFLSLKSAEEDIKEFMRAKKQRDDLSHGQDIVEANLPVETVQKLARKYLQLYLAI